MRVWIKGSSEWNFRYRASISRPQEWFNRSWNGHKGRVETFLRPKPGKDKSPLEELVGRKLHPRKYIILCVRMARNCRWCFRFSGTKGICN